MIAFKTFKLGQIRGQLSEITPVIKVNTTICATVMLSLCLPVVWWPIIRFLNFQIKQTNKNIWKKKSEPSCILLFYFHSGAVRSSCMWSPDMCEDAWETWWWEVILQSCSHVTSESLMMKRMCCIKGYRYLTSLPQFFWLRLLSVEEERNFRNGLRINKRLPGKLALETLLRFYSIACKNNVVQFNVFKTKDFFLFVEHMVYRKRCSSFDGAHVTSTLSVQLLRLQTQEVESPPFPVSHPPY